MLYQSKISFAKVQAIQTSSKIFFVFFTSFDRVWAADHEKQLFTLRKYLFEVDEYKKLEGCRSFQKTHLFQNTLYILLRDFSEFPKIFFSDLASKSESKSIVKSGPDFDIFSQWRYESRRAQRITSSATNHVERNAYRSFS